MANSRTLRVAISFGAATLSGCSSQSTGGLPVEWIEPCRRPACQDVSGAYLVTGQVLGGKLTLRDTRPLESILDLFFEKEKRPVNGHQIELRRPDGNHLQAIVTRNGAVLAETTRESSIEKETGAVIMRQTESKGGSNLPGGHVAANTVRLWKGHDGCLYARLTTHGAGLTVVVPYVDRGEAWGRWEPATSEKVARYAEAREQFAARRPLRIGERFPDFADGRDMLGAPLTRAQLERRGTEVSGQNRSARGLVRSELYIPVPCRGLELIIVDESGRGAQRSRRSSIDTNCPGGTASSRAGR